MSLLFPRSYIIRSKKEIEQLFREGQSVFSYPIKLIYLRVPRTEEAIAFKAGVTVSKKYFKRAVKRNAIKRRMRESIRLNQTLFTSIPPDTTLLIMAIYSSKTFENYQRIDKSMRYLLREVCTTAALKNNQDESD